MKLKNPVKDLILINYITNLTVNEFSGGWSSMNHHIYLQLKKKFSINLIENINPQYDLADKYISKFFRSIGQKGKFPAFTSGRLDRIKKEAETKFNASAVFTFYHGATPWLHCENKLPYALYLDACFASYMKVYHRQEDFSNTQLSQLFKKESNFLSKASAVFFSSQWALNDTKRAYGISGNNFFVASLGGGFNLPLTEYKNSSPYFLFIATDFFGKGGDKVVKAFLKVAELYPGFKLKIAGQQPPAEFLQHKQVQYEGFFNKSDTAEQQKLVALFTNAYCFLLPTSKDMTPLVLMEAASAACPVVATDVYGIPEIVKQNETGFLIAADGQLENNLVEKMKLLCSDISLRNKMGASSWKHINANFSWDKTGTFILNKLSSLEN